MEVNRIQKKLRVSPFDCIKYQIITELVFFKKENLISSDLEFLSLLGLWGPMELRGFCAKAARTVYASCAVEEFPTREQNVRNRMVKLEKRGFVIKEKLGKKMIAINPDLGISMTGSTLLDYNILAVMP